MDLDRTGPIPLYFQVATAIEASIARGDLPPGAKLENEIDLSERLGLSRPTVRRAIQELVDKGLLVRRRGIGTQVVHGRVTHKVELTSLFDDLRNSGKAPTTRLLHFAIIPADAKMASTLAAGIESPILHIRRLHLTNGVPVAVLENFLPEAYTDLDAGELIEHGLYQWVRSRGVTIRVANQKIGARRATTDESELLDIEKHGPVLTMDRTAYDNGGMAVEFGHHFYRPDLYSFEMTLVDK